VLFDSNKYESGYPI